MGPRVVGGIIGEGLKVLRTLWAKRCCCRFRVERQKGARLEAAERTEVREESARCMAQVKQKRSNGIKNNKVNYRGEEMPDGIGHGGVGRMGG